MKTIPYTTPILRADTATAYTGTEPADFEENDIANPRQKTGDVYTVVLGGDGMTPLKGHVRAHNMHRAVQWLLAYCRSRWLNHKRLPKDMRDRRTVWVAEVYTHTL